MAINHPSTWTAVPDSNSKGSVASGITRPAINIQTGGPLPVAESSSAAAVISSAGPVPNPAAHPGSREGSRAKGFSVEAPGKPPDAEGPLDAVGSADARNGSPPKPLGKPDAPWASWEADPPDQSSAVGPESGVIAVLPTDHPVWSICRPSEPRSFVCRANSQRSTCASGRQLHRGSPPWWSPTYFPRRSNDRPSEGSRGPRGKEPISRHPIRRVRLLGRWRNW